MAYVTRIESSAPTIRFLWFAQSFDLRDQLIDFFRSEFSGKLRHVPLPIADHVAQIIAGCRHYARRCQRRSPEASSRSSLPVTLCAICFVNGIVNERSVGVMCLSRDSDGQQANSIDGNRNADGFQLRLTSPWKIGRVESLALH